MQDLMILHDNNIFPQGSKDDFKAYKQLHGTDMQIHSIPNPPKQNARDYLTCMKKNSKYLPWNTTLQTMNLITNLITM
jgi:hypothetical protein